MTEYAERQTDEFEALYVKHVNAMTVEKLHGKANIAAELAYRDWEIEKLQRENEALMAERKEIEAAAFDQAKVSSQMKAVCIGEAFFYKEVSCEQCAHEELNYDCALCEGTGSYMQDFTVPWDTMKEIWKMMNRAYANQLRQQGDRE